MNATKTISLKPRVSNKWQAIAIGLLMAALLFGGLPLKAQYYVVEDFSTAVPKFYHEQPGSNEIATDNLSNLGFNGYPVNHNHELGLMQVITVTDDDADKDWLTPGQNYLYTTGETLFYGGDYHHYSPTIGLSPWRTEGKLTENLVKLTSYTAPSKVALTDIDLQGAFNSISTDVFGRVRLFNAQDEAYNAAMHGYKAGITSGVDRSIDPGQEYNTPQGVWNKTEIASFPTNYFTARSKPRGTVQREYVYDVDWIDGPYENLFSTPIVVGALVFEYSQKPSWWPANTQSQTITFGTDGKVTAYEGGTAKATTSAPGRIVSYIVTDPSIAKVTLAEDGSQVLTPLKKGETTVMAYVTNDANYDGAIKEVTLEVKEAIAVTGVTLDKSELTLAPNADATLVATVAPEDAADRNVTWSSSNEDVATVDAEGKVTAKSVGTAVITATTTVGNYTATATVYVVDYSWLEEVAIAVEGNTARIVGPAESVAKFTKFYVGTTPTDGNSADISTMAGDIELKATTADGAVVKLKYKK